MMTVRDGLAGWFAGNRMSKAAKRAIICSNKNPPTIKGVNLERGSNGTS
jgi:hypothetical protein